MNIMCTVNSSHPRAILLEAHENMTERLIVW